MKLIQKPHTSLTYHLALRSRKFKCRKLAGIERGPSSDTSRSSQAGRIRDVGRKLEGGPKYIEETRHGRRVLALPPPVWPDPRSQEIPLVTTPILTFVQSVSIRHNILGTFGPRRRLTFNNCRLENLTVVINRGLSSRERNIRRILWIIFPLESNTVARMAPRIRNWLHFVLQQPRQPVGVLLESNYAVR